MDRTKPMKPFEQWREEDLPEIYAALRKKERAPAPGPEHLVRPCECNAGWEAFLSPDETHHAQMSELQALVVADRARRLDGELG